MIGSVMAACSFFASTFSPNINWLILTHGVMGGKFMGMGGKFVGTGGKYGAWGGGGG